MAVGVSLTARVRARMAETGESFLVAHAHIVATRGSELEPPDLVGPVAALAPGRVKSSAPSPDAAGPAQKEPFAIGGSAEEVAWGFTPRSAPNPNRYAFEAERIAIFAADVGPQLLAVKLSFGGYAILTPRIQPSGRRAAATLHELAGRFRAPHTGPIEIVFSLADLDEMMADTPRDHEVLVAEADPDGGPFSVAVRVPRVDVPRRCREGYRTVSSDEIDLMLDAFEDITEVRPRTQ